ncbi:putative beta-1,4-xylosyltransferase IRX14H [Acorus calamus]|uniref:Glycosyltransferases n=1 Tax=Acorus calamus TaxID=4465 RepID=A0AAV9DFI6_ACOCL|nr:putative beta-1,4-xylosyltransferase IRX14H [Acorus calamus]
MKFQALLQQGSNGRRSNSFRCSSTAPAASSPSDCASIEAGGGGGGGGVIATSGGKSNPFTLFWLVLHGICCLVSLVLGFRFSRIVFFLLFTSPSSVVRTTDTVVSLQIRGNQTTVASLSAAVDLLPKPAKHVVVGRHGIRIRPWPHPDPSETMRAHRLIERVQREQRAQYESSVRGGGGPPRRVIAVTPTYVRTFQTLHLTGLTHSLMLAPYDLTWIVVEAGGKTEETANFIASSGLETIHVGFDERMPSDWEGRHRMEAAMRLHALRLVREKKLDGIVVFTDDSNMHSMELFDEIQSVKWVGAIAIGILAHSVNLEADLAKEENKEEGFSPIPIQGPACNSSNQLAGWHTFNSLPYMEKSAQYIGDRATVLPRKVEWAGFVINSRLVWKEEEDRPEWVRDLDEAGEIESPLDLLNDESFVEPLGNCGRKVLAWWLRVEARGDSKFPRGWVINPPLEITVPAKRTPWPDAPPESDNAEKHPSKGGRTSRSRQGSRGTLTQESQDSEVTGIGSNVEER